MGSFSLDIEQEIRLKNRILYCTDSLMPGGIERQLTELATRLDRTRFELHVLCLYGTKAGRSLHFLEPLQDAGIPVDVLELGWSPADKLRGWAGIIRAAWRLRPDVLHALNYHSNLLSRLARPLLPPSTRPLGAVRIEQTAKQLRYHALSWRLCSAIACNSPHIRQQLIDRAGVPADKLHFIPNGVDLDRFASVPPARPPEGGFAYPQGSRRTFLQVGRISPVKAPTLLVEAVGRLRASGAWPEAARVVFLGESETTFDDYRQALDDRIAALGMEAIVTRLPRTDQPEAFYHAADVVVLPSTFEGMPNVALEALAAGRPVIISEAANAAGVIAQGETGWVVRTGDVEHLAAALQTALALPEDDMANMRETCRQRSLDFSMAKMVASYQDLYARLCAKPIP